MFMIPQCKIQSEIFRERRVLLQSYIKLLICVSTKQSHSYLTKSQRVQKMIFLKTLDQLPSGKNITKNNLQNSRIL